MVHYYVTCTERKPSFNFHRPHPGWNCLVFEMFKKSFSNITGHARSQLTVLASVGIPLLSHHITLTQASGVCISYCGKRHVDFKPTTPNHECVVFIRLS